MLNRPEFILKVLGPWFTYVDEYGYVPVGLCPVKFLHQHHYIEDAVYKTFFLTPFETE